MAATVDGTSGDFLYKIVSKMSEDGYLFLQNGANTPEIWCKYGETAQLREICMEITIYGPNFEITMQNMVKMAKIREKREF